MLGDLIINLPRHMKFRSKVQSLFLFYSVVEMHPVLKGNLCTSVRKPLQAQTVLLLVEKNKYSSSFLCGALFGSGISVFQVHISNILSSVCKMLRKHRIFKEPTCVMY